MESYIVVSSGALAVLRQSEVISADELINSIETRLFPDGSLLTTKGNAYLTEQFQRVSVLEKVVVSTAFRSISGYGNKSYAMWYPSYYQERLGELSLNLVPRVATPVGPYEHLLSCLPIAVSFKRRLSSNMQADFLSALGDWQSTVNEVCQSAGTAVVGNRVSIGRRSALFSLDLQDADHTSVLWLILRILQFGISAATVDCISCGQDEDVSRFGIKAEEQRVMISLPGV
jgi:hypothetical protein